MMANSSTRSRLMKFEQIAISEIIVDKFTLTEYHVKLLEHMYVEWEDGGYDGAPAIGLKRPYGNSDVVGDVHEILFGCPFPEDEDDEERDEATVNSLLKIHEETHIALQIVLCTKSFQPGVYEKANSYAARSWRLVA